MLLNLIQTIITKHNRTEVL